MTAWPSLAAINAALLVEAGFLGPRTMLEGESSFWRMAGSDRFEPERLTVGLGERFEIERIYFKPYPTCRWNQGALDGAREILGRRRWGARDVADIEVGVPRLLIDQHFDDYAPHTLVDAQFSLPYALAVILHGEEPSPHWYDPPLFDSASIRDTMRKVTLRHDDDMERLYLDKRSIGAVLRMTATDGSTETTRVDYPRGSQERPVDDTELQAKYRALAHSAIEPIAAERLLENIADLQRLDRAAQLGTLAASG